MAAVTNQTQAEAVEEDEAIKTHILEKLRARTEVIKVREAEEEVTPIFKQKAKMKEEEVEVEAEAEVRTKINIHTLEKQKISQHLETRETEIKIKEAAEEAKIGYIQTTPKESQKETLDKIIKI